MQIITRDLSCLPRSPRFSDRACVLDIATEGRYWRTSRLVSVSVIYQAEDRMLEKTYLSEKEADEYDILYSLSRLLPEMTPLYTFNGTSFDLPHLARKFTAYRLPDPVTGREHVDLYLALRPLDPVLPLESHRLADYFSLLSAPGAVPGGDNGTKALKAAADRTDSILKSDTPSAPELDDAVMALETTVGGTGSTSEAYTSSVPEADDAVMALQATVLLDLLDFFRGNLTAGPGEIRDDSLLIPLKPELPLPLSLSLADGPFSLAVSPEGAVLTARLFDGKLRRYYTNVEDYDYLPLEGYAVHHAVSAYVGKSRKEKAVRENCFTLVSCTEALVTNGAALQKYAASALAFLLSKQ